MHDEPPPLDPLVGAYYERVPEESRLEVGAFRLEEARTRELVKRHAPAPPARVLDVGGAAGAYAFWLAEQGDDVSLIDAAPRLVALAEARRVLRAGGVLIAAAISRWASALDGLSRNALGDPVFARIVERDLVDGQHRNPTDHFEYFTTAYFHRPEELRDEVGAAGLTVEAVYGIEGPGWIFPDFMARWNDERGRDDLLHVARSCESEPSMIGCSAHLLVVATKPRGRSTG